MIPACLHDYAMRSVLRGLMNANLGNVRFWHDAVVYIYDMVTKPRPKPAPRHPGVFLPNVCSNKHTGNNA
ncbi:hypothetical protein DK872_06520 [Kosakonia sp. MH5]|nr:hypothetical protein [Kosakonia sp. MH5]